MLIWSVGWKPIVELNIFYNHAVHIIRPQNTESGEPELKNVGEESQDNHELIIHNTIINARWEKINDMIQLFISLLQDS